MKTPHTAIRIPTDLKERIRDAANSRCISMTEFIITAVKKQINEN